MMCETAERMEQLNQESIRTLKKKKDYKYLGILELDTSKQAEMMGKIRKEYLRRRRKLLITKP